MDWAVPSGFERTEPERRRVDWRAVAVFFGVACAVSWPVFAWRDLARESWLASPLPGVVRGLLPALGPTLGALVARWAFRRTHPATVSLGGTSPARAVAFAAVPVVGLAALGVPDAHPHVQGALVGLDFLVYGLLEEAGWRGFLQDALRPLAEARRVVVVALLWGVWHFTTFVHGGPAATARSLGFMAAVWLLGSWGLGRAVDRTRALLVPGALHIAFNLTRALERGSALVWVGGCVVAWVVLLRTWPATRATPARAA